MKKSATTLPKVVKTPTPAVEKNSSNQSQQKKSSNNSTPKDSKLPTISPNKTCLRSQPEASSPDNGGSPMVVVAIECPHATAEPCNAQDTKAMAENIVSTESTIVTQFVSQDAANCSAVDASKESIPVEEEPFETTGNITLLYEQYNELFPIVNGSITAAQIDEEYCLSFVMPNCRVRLSTHSPDKRRQMIIDGSLDYYDIKEDPQGTFTGLRVGRSYYVYAEQDSEQLERDQKRMQQVAATMEGAGEAKSGAAKKGGRDDGRVLESCSCVYGNPCLDEYGCKDWGNRYAIATKNGWKGF